MTELPIRFAFVILLLLATLAASSHAANLDDSPEADPLVVARLEKFQDRKFGLMMHWGIYSQWGCIESWPLVEEDRWARPDDLQAVDRTGKDFTRFSARLPRAEHDLQSRGGSIHGHGWRPPRTPA